MKYSLRHITGFALLAVLSAFALFSIYYNWSNPYSKQNKNSSNPSDSHSRESQSSKPPVRSSQEPQSDTPPISSSQEPQSSISRIKPNPQPPDKRKVPEEFLKLKNKYNLVEIPTYDGSYQLTHPKVLYFKEGWNHYQYWMSMTPYPYGNDYVENPSIVVSNDGVNWITPKGLVNPVSGVPKDVKKGGHYSDSHLVMRGNTMELWYRYNPSLPNEKNLRRPDNATNIYYRKTTTDGIHWTKAQKLLQSRKGLLSLCVNYEDSLYKTWYATYGGDLFYSQSKDAQNWSEPLLCNVPLPKGLYPYHQDLIKYNSTYYLLQTAQQRSNYTFRLFLFTSKDGIHFENPQPIYPNQNMELWEGVSFYRSTVFVKDDKLDLYISLIIPRLKWYMTQTSIPLPKSD